MARSNPDLFVLFATRIVRLFAYGFLSVILALYLAAIGYKTYQIGLLLTLTLAGDAAVSLFITTSADRIGRKRMLILSAGLMIMAGGIFLLTRNYFWLAVAAILGIISPSGNEIGPFMSLEQAALTGLVSDHKRTHYFAWYNLSGSLATAVGALAAGWGVRFLQRGGSSPLAAYHGIFMGYTFLGSVLLVMFLSLSGRIEAAAYNRDLSIKTRFGLHGSRKLVLKLSGLFSMDAFAGGLVVQSIMAYWFYLRFKADAATLGGIFFGANLLAGISSLLAARLARRFGLIRTMVFTHIPSNILLIIVPFMPNLTLAIVVLLMRFSISQMDVPTRQSYTMAVVKPNERAAAAGITAVARSVGAAVSPSLSGILMAGPLFFNAPFILSGAIKIVYDLLLYFNFRKVTPPEEKHCNHVIE
jgi:MFS family permease